MDFLQQLNIKNENAGTSTGSKNITGTGEKIESYSPVDGKLIGSVWATSREGYDETLQDRATGFFGMEKVPGSKTW